VNLCILGDFKVLEKMGYERYDFSVQAKHLEPRLRDPTIPQDPGVDQSHNWGFQALNSLIPPPLDEDPLYPHPHMAQQKLLGRLALPGGLFTSSRSLASANVHNFSIQTH
jgi:hypothetical protein